MVPPEMSGQYRVHVAVEFDVVPSSALVEGNDSLVRGAEEVGVPPDIYMGRADVSCVLSIVMDISRPCPDRV